MVVVRRQHSDALTISAGDDYEAIRIVSYSTSHGSYSLVSEVSDELRLV